MSVTVTQELTQQTVTVTGNPVENNVTVTVSNARGPAGPNSVTSATTSDGTANLLLAAATVSGTLTAPTAATTTSTTQVATTAFVQQEIASGVAVAKNLEFLAHNGSGSTIAKGSIVYINGAVSGVPRITKSQANNDTNSARTIGFVKADIANGANGFVIIEGELLNVSTADSSGIIGAGIQIYLSPTIPGAFTRTKPSAPNHLVYVGVVVTASTGANLDGKILVGIQNGYELDEIHDVSITAPVAAKQVIKRNAGNTLWVNEAIATSDVTGLDQELSALLPRLSSITVTGTTPAFPDPLVEQGSLNYGRRAWASGDGGTLLYDGANWLLTQLDPDDTMVYQASKTSGSYEPWKLTGWGLSEGSGQPTFTIDPPALLPVNASGTIALTSGMDGQPDKLTGGTISGATAFASGATFTYNGTSASDHRIALGAGTTGATLFGAADAAAARTTLGLATTDSVTFTGIAATGTITATTTHPTASAITATQGIYSSFLGANQSAGAFIGCSVSGAGVGFANASTGSLFPCNASGTLTNGVMNLGRADYRFNNYFGTNGNFSGTLAVTGATTLTGAVTTANFIAGVEMTAPAAPAANGYRIFAEDNGGKTRLMVLFATGAAQQIAIEP